MPPKKTIGNAVNKRKSKPTSSSSYTVNGSTLAELINYAGITEKQTKAIHGKRPFFFWKDIEEEFSAALVRTLQSKGFTLRNYLKTETKARNPATEETGIVGAMTTKEYRRKLIKAGLTINQDDHVPHIIAKANGGADHTDNYFFVVGMKCNIAWGKHHDAYMAYHVGLARAKKAVEISKKMGGYKGPDAATLVRRGEELSRADDTS